MRGRHTVSTWSPYMTTGLQATISVDGLEYKMFITRDEQSVDEFFYETFVLIDTNIGTTKFRYILREKGTTNQLEIAKRKSWEALSRISDILHEGIIISTDRDKLNKDEGAI